MTPVRIVVLTSLAMIAFAGNSLLCRLALKHTSIDAASFTTLRLAAGALALWLIVRIRSGAQTIEGDWISAFALVVYAAGFSFAYVDLSTATGALLLFGAVQATMIGRGIWAGETMGRTQILGLMLAIGGVVGLLLPGVSAPSLYGSIWMIGAGVAWGIYSLRGRVAGDPGSTSAGNFLRAVPLALLLSAFMFKNAELDHAGFWYAVSSGALASGMGYAIWYTVLPALKTTQASIVQLSVPVIAALGGSVFLGEAITHRLILAAIATLGGIALVVSQKHNM